MGRNVRKGTLSEGMKTFGASVVTGVASLTSFGHPANLPRYPHQSSLEALRDDWRRIGSDMKDVIASQNAQIEKKKD